MQFLTRQEFYKIARFKYFFRYSEFKKNNIPVDSGIFFETILMLERLEDCIEKLQSGCSPAIEYLQAAIDENDEKVQQEIFDFYTGFKIDMELVQLARPIYLFRSKVEDYISLYRRSENPFEATESWSKDYFIREKSIIFDFIGLYQMVLDGFNHHTKKAPKENENIDSKTRAAERKEIEQKKLSHHLKKIENKYQEEVSNFESFLSKNNCLNILCIDFILDPDSNFLDEKYWALNNLRDIGTRPMNQLLGKYGLVSYWFKMNRGINHQLHLESVLIFKEKKNFNEEVIEEFLKEHIQKYFYPAKGFRGQNYSDIISINMNISSKRRNEIFKQVSGDNKIVGNIYFSSKAMKSFKKWVLGYLYQTELFLRPHFDEIDNGNIFYIQHNTLRDNPSDSVEPQKKVNKQRYSEKNIKIHSRLIDLKFSKHLLTFRQKQDLNSESQKICEVMSYYYRQNLRGIVRSDDEIDEIIKIEYLMHYIEANLENLTNIFEKNTNVAFENKISNPQRYLSKEFVQLICLLKVHSEINFIQLDSFRNEFSWRFQVLLQHLKRLEKILWLTIKDRREIRAGLKNLTNDIKWELGNLDWKQENSNLLSSKSDAKKLEQYLKSCLSEEFIAIRFKLELITDRDKGLEEKLPEQAFRDFIKNLKRIRGKKGTDLLGYAGVKLRECIMDITMMFDCVGFSSRDINKISQQADKIIDEIGNYGENFFEISNLNKKKYYQRRFNKKDVQLLDDSIEQSNVKDLSFDNSESFLDTLSNIPEETQKVESYFKVEVLLPITSDSLIKDDSDFFIPKNSKEKSDFIRGISNYYTAYGFQKCGKSESYNSKYLVKGRIISPK